MTAARRTGFLRCSCCLAAFAVATLVALATVPVLRADQGLHEAFQSLLPENRGVVGLLGISADDSELIGQIAESREWTVYIQTADWQDARQLRTTAAAVGLSGSQVCVETGSLQRIHVSPNLLDAVFILPAAAHQADDQEILRVLRPGGRAMIGDRLLIKPWPSGMDDWSHPYHGPDNNPQSEDQLVRGEFETQFIGYPKFSPMPEQTVVAGGRIYKAMGHIAHKANQNEMLNTLLCINAWNGTILWRRPLSPGFMIHRNTMVATDDALYMGDHQTCQVIDGVTGENRRQITVPQELSDGPVWKWMAIEGDVLFALVGNPEVRIETLRSDRPGLGHWPWGMWDGHDYSDPRTAFGFGRTLLAVDRNSGSILWYYRDDEFLDARALCMKNGRIYCFCPEKFLACINARTGALEWKNTDEALLNAIGPNERAQHYVTGYATTCYMKCSDDYLFFAGPQRRRMVVASAADGSLLWTNEIGNLQLVLRADAIYAAGPQNSRSMLLDYSTGAELASLPARRACTRATGCADSIFYRASGGTVRVMTNGEIRTEHIAPMRPPCQDGVIVSNGHLYWGPWMCGCQLSLYGNIGLKPADVRSHSGDGLSDIEQSSLNTQADGDRVQMLPVSDQDWLTYRASCNRTDESPVSISDFPVRRWTADLVTGDLPTAPVAGGGHVFVADRTGAVHAYDIQGKPVWTLHTAGPIFYPPAVADSRLYVGCGDGCVYALEAATGRVLWTFRVAPQDERIMIFNRLVSRWPVAGGVIVHSGKVYAAAGITHYDGTYVVALDALTGRLLARNDSSGQLSEQVNSGISMQGEPAIVNDELQFAGGGVYEVARFDLTDLRCLNEPRHQLSSDYRTAFYAWYPEYNRFVSLEHTRPDGNILSYDANYDGSEFSSLALETPRPEGSEGRLKKDLAGEFLRRRGREAPPRHVWQDSGNRRCTAFAICGETLLVAGHTRESPDQPMLSAVRIADGEELWSHPLPADTVRGGIAVNAAGHIFLTLDNGQLICFGSPN